MRTSRIGNYTRQRRPESGFSMIEMAVATAVLLFGVVMLAELVPASLQLNMSNRFDSTSVVIAQRELDQMIDQPITATQFTDADGRVILLGNAATPNVVVGGPVVMVGNSARVNFTPADVANYNFNFVDPNDPVRPTYEVRWAVITQVQTGTIISKRILVGVYNRNNTALLPSVTVEAWVQK